MSEDKELLKKCWDEYTDQFDLFGDEWHDLGCDEIFKAGFLAAKRSQPSAVLPEPYVDYDEDDNPCKYWTKKQIDKALTAAGIKYTIGE